MAAVSGDPMSYFDSRREFKAVNQKLDDLKTLFLSVNRRLNAVQELYEMFTGKGVGDEEPHGDQ